MTTTPPEKPGEFAIVGQGSIFDGIAYWVTLAGVYLMVGGLMFYSGKEKLFDEDGNAPQGSRSSSRERSSTRSRGRTLRGSSSRLVRRSRGSSRGPRRSTRTSHRRS
jgi:hypothetical protein